MASAASSSAAASAGFRVLGQLLRAADVRAQRAEVAAILRALDRHIGAGGGLRVERQLAAAFAHRHEEQVGAGRHRHEAARRVPRAGHVQGIGTLLPRGQHRRFAGQRLVERTGAAERRQQPAPKARRG